LLVVGDGSFWSAVRNKEYASKIMLLSQVLSRPSPLQPSSHAGDIAVSAGRVVTSTPTYEPESGTILSEKGEAMQAIPLDQIM
jgi:hypothetical protein